MLLEDSSVVSAVSKDGKLGDLSPLRINNDSHHPLPCPPTENVGYYDTTLNQKIPSCSHIIPDPYHKTVRNESSAINTTNTGSLVGVKESGRLPWPRNSHTVRRRVARKPQGIIYVARLFVGRLIFNKIVLEGGHLFFSKKRRTGTAPQVPHGVQAFLFFRGIIGGIKTLPGQAMKFLHQRPSGIFRMIELQ